MDPKLELILKRPFAEQVAFFRQKKGNLLPSERWTDVWQAQHDRGFMVAGAQTADLLSDLAAAVDKVIVQGGSLQAFRKDFDQIVARHGWSHTGERNWRTRTIYTTNMATSYSAGRLAQLREGGYAYWIYKHSGLSSRPRPQHVAWSGLCLPQDDPWWRTHYPPNGWGCKCRVVGARSPEQAARLGGKLRPAPVDGMDPRTGAPAGIDKGWDYQPGNSVSDSVRALAPKVRHWDYSLAKAWMQGLPESARDDLARAYRALPSTADDARRYARRVLDKRTHLDLPPYQTLGLLTSKDAALVKALKGLDVDGFDYALDPSAILHILKEHGDAKTEAKRGQRAVEASDYAKLPELLNAPDVVEDGGDAWRTGLPLVRYAKQFGDEEWNLMLEVRKGRKMLVPETLFVRKRRSGPTPTP